MYTVTPADLTFTVPYYITAKRNDYLDALVSFFTVEFSRCHKRTGITTCELREGGRGRRGEKGWRKRERERGRKKREVKIHVCAGKCPTPKS